MKMVVWQSLTESEEECGGCQSFQGNALIVASDMEIGDRMGSIDRYYLSSIHIPFIQA